MENTDKSHILNFVNELIERLKNEYSIDSVYLYGSHSYGKPNMESDIDVALILNETINNDKDFDIFVKAQQINLDLETVLFSKDEFENNFSDLIVEIKNKGERVA